MPRHRSLDLFLSLDKRQIKWNPCSGPIACTTVRKGLAIAIAFGGLSSRHGRIILLLSVLELFACPTTATQWGGQHHDTLKFELRACQADLIVLCTL